MNTYNIAKECDPPVVKESIMNSYYNLLKRGDSLNETYELSNIILKKLLRTEGIEEKSCNSDPCNPVKEIQTIINLLDNVDANIRDLTTKTNNNLRQIMDMID